jgi:hypothetical protein
MLYECLLTLAETITNDDKNLAEEETGFSDIDIDDITLKEDDEDDDDDEELDNEDEDDLEELDNEDEDEDKDKIDNLDR